MLSFLKVFARGIIVTILLPIILSVLALYGVYCLGLFVFMFIKGVIDFFKGKTFDTNMPEDLEARRLVLEKEKQNEQAKEMLNMMYQSTMVRPETIYPNSNPDVHEDEDGDNDTTSSLEDNNEEER